MGPEATYADAVKSQVGLSSGSDGDPASDEKVGEDWVTTGSGDLMPREDDIEASIRVGGAKEVEGTVGVNEGSVASVSEPPMEVAESVTAGSGGENGKQE